VITPEPVLPTPSLVFAPVDPHAATVIREASAIDRSKLIGAPSTREGRLSHARCQGGEGLIQAPRREWPQRVFSFGTGVSSATFGP
jgi:hypothetical protein